ncbi:hypothetical protein ONZ45_g6369 [Pleurotus djamor]|nr:hypothetical protein ONZ45_g6369 [Pleurotus djamor]
MASYNIHQQIWVLCASSGIATASVGTQAVLQELMSAHLQPTIDTMEIGNWKMVWGPNVGKANPDDTSAAADHTWYVARNPSAVFEDGNPYDTYVVSITGTATNSQVDADEDNRIGQVVDFNAWSQLGFESTPLPSSQVD